MVRDFVSLQAKVKKKKPISMADQWNPASATELYVSLEEEVQRYAKEHFSKVAVEEQ
jgi:hypothetical protein